MDGQPPSKLVKNKKGYFMAELVQTFGELLFVLGKLVVEIVQLGWKASLLIGWIAWWLLGVNWQRVWPVLGQGAWVPALLTGILTALICSQAIPYSSICLGVVRVANTFWWQLGVMGMLMISALLCGWVQGIFGWAPGEVELQPTPTPAEHGHTEH